MKRRLEIDQEHKTRPSVSPLVPTTAESILGECQGSYWHVISVSIILGLLAQGTGEREYRK